MKYRLELLLCLISGHVLIDATKYLQERYPDAWRILLCKRCLGDIVMKLPTRDV